MLFSQLGPVAWAAAVASVCSGSPMPLDLPLVGQRQHELALPRGLDAASPGMSALEKRQSADFSMDKSWDNEVLFAGSWVNTDGIASAESVSLSITCLDCWTRGTVTASLTDADIIDPSIRLDFSGVEAYVELGIDISAGASYSINLFATESPIGLGFPGLDVGVLFFVDLVFSLTELIDLEGGFYVQLADGAFLEASVFGGAITKSFFDGMTSKSLPVKVKAGRATFKADLRLRVQCGAEANIDIFGIGAGAELGIYANLMEFVAEVETTPACELQTVEWWDLNVGAFAQLDVEIDWKTLGVVPTVSTTLLSAAAQTQCWIGVGGGSGSGSGSGSGGATTPTGTAVSASYSGSILLPGGSGSTGTLSTIASPTLTTPPTISGTGSFSTGKYPLANSSTPTGTTSPAGSGSGSGSGELVTSTVYTTSLYTITSCAASVPNCPASYQSTIVVTKTVDICPVAAETTTPSPAAALTTGSASPAPATVTVQVTDVVVLQPCPTPVVETYAPPPPPSSYGSSSSTPAGGEKIVATMTVLPASSSSTQNYQWGNGTTLSWLATGKPSASWSPTTKATSTGGSSSGPTQTPVTAGAGRLVFPTGGSDSGAVTTLVGLMMGVWLLLLL